MKTDRELLELAAKAAGICLHPADKLMHSYGNWGCDTTCTVCSEDPSDARWNPLADDGDALRLAVKLKIDFYIGNDDGEAAFAGFFDATINNRQRFAIERFENSNAIIATRRAIVRAAAQIGEANEKVEVPKAAQ